MAHGLFQSWDHSFNILAIVLAHTSLALVWVVSRLSEPSIEIPGLLSAPSKECCHPPLMDYRPSLRIAMEKIP
jgi:hypothetical protein